MQLFVVIASFVGDAGGLEKWRADHLQFLAQLDDRNVLVGAGPTLDSVGRAYCGDGMLIVMADSVAGAHQLVAHDPYYLHGIRKYKITPWLLSEGVIFDQLMSCQTG